MGPVLVCAATDRELAACGAPAPASGSEVTHKGRIFAVTGAGIPLTLLRLPALIARHRPSLVLNVGIAGAYPGSGLSLGDVAAGESEVFGDLGVEIPGAERFRPVAAMPWGDPIYREPLALAPEALALPERAGAPRPRPARGCTVNACAGTRETGELRRRLFGADFESMEGAAAALAGLQAGVPVAEVRAISNLASERDMRPENIARALDALEACLRPWVEAAP